MQRLTGRSCVITGAGSGIGRASALRFAAEGAQVFVVGRRTENTEETVALVQAAGGSATAHVTDASVEANVEAIVARCLAELDGLDVFFANIAVTGTNTPLLEQSLAEWDEVMRANLYSCFLAVKYAGRHMTAQGRGSIILTSSAASLRANAGAISYSASKAAVNSLAQTAANAFAGTGVRVNAILPGLVETQVTKKVFEQARERGVEGRIGHMTPLKRAGRPEEIAAMLVGRDLASASAGHARLVAQLERQVSRGRLGADAATAIAASVRPTDSDAELAGCGAAIESVPEDRALKETLLRRIEAALPVEAWLATNTSGLPIGGLAGALRRPERFLGLHFFSPVERMKLVEVVRSTTTSQATVDVALAFVAALGQKPIVVRDGPGFFTTRVFAAYLDEALALLAEGVAAAAIEAAALANGRAVGPSPCSTRSRSASICSRRIRPAPTASTSASAARSRDRCWSACSPSAGAGAARAVASTTMPLTRRSGSGPGSMRCSLATQRSPRRRRSRPGFAQPKRSKPCAASRKAC